MPAEPDFTEPAAAPLDLDDITLTDAIRRVLAAARSPQADATPLDANTADSTLYLVDLGRRRDRIQGSLLARVHDQGDRVHRDGVAAPAPAAEAETLDQALHELHAQNLLLAHAPRGAGGLLACVARMALAGRVGAALNVDLLVTGGDGVSDGRMDSGEVKNWTQQVSGRRAEQTLRALFAEEVGCVLQVRTADRSVVMQALRCHDLGRCTYFIGKTRPAAAATDQGKDALTIWRDAAQIFGATLAQLAHPERIGEAVPRSADEMAAPAPKPKSHEEKINELRLGVTGGTRIQYKHAP
jgi:phosphoribosylformylglycinamidine synthase